MNKYIAPLSILTILLLIAEIIFSCQLVIDGKVMKQTDSEIERLHQEESFLSHQIASASSLLVIAEKAKIMGFVASANVVTIRPDQFVVALGTSR